MVSAASNKKQRLADILHYKVKVITLDSREFIGELLSFDKHYNLILANAEEYRLTKKSLIALKDKKPEEPEANLIQEQKRSLGLIILRGEHVISVTTESSPLNATQKLKLKPGNGVIKQLKNPNMVISSKSNNIKLKNPVKTGGIPGFSGAPRGFNPPPGFTK